MPQRHAVNRQGGDDCPDASRGKRFRSIGPIVYAPHQPVQEHNRRALVGRSLVDVMVLAGMKKLDAGSHVRQDQRMKPRNKRDLQAAAETVIPAFCCSEHRTAVFSKSWPSYRY
jgi:hypothetical protein